LGSNSIGWSLIVADDEGNPVKILKAGSRIIPMSQDILGNLIVGRLFPKRQNEQVIAVSVVCVNGIF
ncbi:MAG: hypothetical protein LIO97_02645, partial [Tannerellaceae bacterium]|nr:hypothetical protein [Tannerellaceae bacterium]